MDVMKYIKFTEYNEWEGETWNWYMPLKGNGKDFKKIKVLIRYNSSYRIEKIELTKNSLNALIEHSSDGYMKSHNRAIGFRNIPKEIDWVKDDPFYKGQMIRETLI